MKRRIQIITAVLLLLTMLVPASVFGADSSVSITGGKSAKVGDTVTVTVTYRGDALGYVNGQLTYDNSKMEYLSGGSSQGDAGLVELKEYASDASGKLSFQVKFRAVDFGSVALNLETLETQNLDGDQSMGTPSASRTLRITGSQSAATDSSQEDATTEPETDASTESTEATETGETQTTESESGEPSDTADSGEENGVNFVVVGVIAAVILILIAIIAIALRRKGKK